MEVLNLLLYVGAVWVVAALVFFAWNLFGGSLEHADRLALLPLDESNAERSPQQTQEASMTTKGRGAST